MRRRDMAKLAAAGAGVLLSRNAAAQANGAAPYPRTPAEVAARVTPTDYRYAALPVVDVRRYGFDPAAPASNNTAGIESAIAALPRVFGAPAGTIQLPPGSLPSVQEPLTFRSTSACVALGCMRLC